MRLILYLCNSLVDLNSYILMYLHVYELRCLCILHFYFIHIICMDRTISPRQIIASFYLSELSHTDSSDQLKYFKYSKNSKCVVTSYNFVLFSSVLARWTSILPSPRSTPRGSGCVVTGWLNPAWKALELSWRNTWRG